MHSTRAEEEEEEGGEEEEDDEEGKRKRSMSRSSHACATEQVGKLQDIVRKERKYRRRSLSSQGRNVPHPTPPSSSLPSLPNRHSIGRERGWGKGTELSVGTSRQCSTVKPFSAQCFSITALHFSNTPGALEKKSRPVPYLCAGADSRRRSRARGGGDTQAEGRVRLLGSTAMPSCVLTQSQASRVCRDDDDEQHAAVGTHLPSAGRSTPAALHSLR